jgi:two-component system, NtrC family, sensor histidine kinase HydH
MSFAGALREMLACGVILLDAPGEATFISVEAGRILGLAATAAAGASAEALPAAVQKLVGEALDSGKEIAGREVELGGGARKPVTAWVSVLPLRASAGGRGAVVVIHDMTSAKRLDQNLRHFDRLASVGTLSSSMAHEIRNALVAGKTFFDLLLEKHYDAELVDVARREIRRVEDIVTRMLKFVGSTEQAFEEVHLHEVLEHSLRLVQPQLEDKQITLTRSFQAGSDLVKGNALQLQQAFVNLFLNALEAMAPNGTLTVITESIPAGAGPARSGEAARAAQLRLTIQDTGAGIPPESMGRLFEPFFTTKSDGTGLGLPITRRIILEHGGEISVESAPVNGTTFRITLPAS